MAARGALFISSAGNDANNNDATPHWPSNINTPTTISVAALDRTGALWYAHSQVLRLCMRVGYARSQVPHLCMRVHVSQTFLSPTSACQHGSFAFIRSHAPQRGLTLL